MIDSDKRKAVMLLHREGMKVREISRRLGISRNSVRAIFVSFGNHQLPGQPVITDS